MATFMAGRGRDPRLFALCCVGNFYGRIRGGGYGGWEETAEVWGGPD